MPIINRALSKLVIEALGVFPAVYINGPRQAGKSTLVRDIILPEITGPKIKGEGHAGQYITFDDVLERASALRNPQNYLEATEKPLIIDEIQMVPELFRPLKMIIDEERHERLISGSEKPNGRYLLTGSANLAALPALADAMVGRMATKTLYPLGAFEVYGGHGDFVKRAFACDFRHANPAQKPLFEAIEKATFPELLNLPQAQHKSWYDNYLRKVTLEDPRQIYNLEKADHMPVLLQALAVRAGNLINDADLSRDTGLTSVTARTYRQLLSATFISLELRPWFRNIGKRLIKSSKSYFYDTGLLCHTLGRNVQELKTYDPARFGNVLENYVATELLKLISISDEHLELLFYHTRDGREVDFVIEKPTGELVGIEVKNAESISDKDLVGLKELQAVAGKDFVCGIVLCNTPRVLPYGDKIWLVPFSYLWH
jgi:hypothetical protein